MSGIISEIVANRTGGEVRGQDNTQSGKVMNAQPGVLVRHPPLAAGRSVGIFKGSLPALLIPQQ